MYSNLSKNEAEILFQQKKIIIYGTGHIGKKFMLALKKLGLRNNVLCFARTDSVKEGEELDAFPVYKISQITMDDDCLMCLAVHSAIRDEMIAELKKNQIEQYIWIYPYLYEWMLGVPIKKDVRISVDCLKEASKLDYRMAIRFLAIEQFLGKNNCGFDIYVRAFLLQCDEKTAKKRLEKFCELIESWIERGYDPEYKVQLSQNMEIIDGNHRVSLAMYFGEKEVVCDIFSLEFPIVELHGEGAMLTKDVLVKAGFVRDEIQLLDEMMMRL